MAGLCRHALRATSLATAGRHALWRPCRDQRWFAYHALWNGPLSTPMPPSVTYIIAVAAAVAAAEDVTGPVHADGTALVLDPEAVTEAQVIVEAFGWLSSCAAQIGAVEAAAPNAVGGAPDLEGWRPWITGCAALAAHGPAGGCSKSVRVDMLYNVLAASLDVTPKSACCAAPGEALAAALARAEARRLPELWNPRVDTAMRLVDYAGERLSRHHAGGAMSEMMALAWKRDFGGDGLASLMLSTIGWTVAAPFAKTCDVPSGPFADALQAAQTADGACTEGGLPSDCLAQCARVASHGHVDLVAVHLVTFAESMDGTDGAAAMQLLNRKAREQAPHVFPLLLAAGRLAIGHTPQALPPLYAALEQTETDTDRRVVQTLINVVEADQRVSTAEWRRARALHHEAMVERPELLQFVECAHAAGRALGLGSEAPVFVASDSAPTAERVAHLVGDRGVWNEQLDHRVDGFQERVGDERQALEAAVELAVLSRAKAVVGTHLSTYSALAAAMSASPGHAMVLVGHQKPCIATRSPLGGLVPDRLPSELQHLYSFELDDLRMVSCFDEAMHRAVTAAAGSFQPGVDAGPLGPGEDEWAATLRGEGPQTAVMASDVARARLALDAYEARRTAWLAAAEDGDEGRAWAVSGLLVGSSYAFNLANRAMTVTALMLVALHTNRLLVIDERWMPGFQAPGGLGLNALPDWAKAQALAAVNGTAMRMANGWQSAEVGLCSDPVPATCRSTDPVCTDGDGSFARTVVHMVANAESRGWVEALLGTTGAGLQEIMRFLFLPSPETLRSAEEVERRLCGGVGACGIAIHVRRGGVKDNIYFAAA